MSPATFPVSPLTPSWDKNFVISFSRVHSGGFRLRQAWCPGHPRAFESEGDVQSGAAGCPPPSGPPGSGGSSPPGSLLLLPSPRRLMRLPTACRQMPCARLFALRSASHCSVGLLTVPFSLPPSPPRLLGLRTLLQLPPLFLAVFPPPPQHCPSPGHLVCHLTTGVLLDRPFCPQASPARCRRGHLLRARSARRCPFLSSG